jgi:hypothetical protein
MITLGGFDRLRQDENIPSEGRAAAVLPASINFMNSRRLQFIISLASFNECEDYACLSAHPLPCVFGQVWTPLIKRF